MSALSNLQSRFHAFQLVAREMIEGLDEVVISESSVS